MRKQALLILGLAIPFFFEFAFKTNLPGQSDQIECLQSDNYSTFKIKKI